VAQEVAAWREERARRIDIPVRHVLPDLALQAMAHQPPTSRTELAAIRGLDGRFLRAELPDELLAAVERGRRLPPEALALPPADEVPRELRPAVALAMAWVAQLARDEAIDAAVLATRSDVVAFLLGQPDGRLGQGWRAELVGEPLRRLVAGDAALAFDGAGGLLVEERSRRPLRPGGGGAGG
jgi:ribonuclease D